MKPNYSNSLMLVWQVADFEAKRLHAFFIEPAHLLLGLCKCVDIDIPAFIPASLPERDNLIEELLREFRRLREVFRGAGLDTMRFRRHFRTVLPEGSAGLNPSVGRLHRSDAARDVFRTAEKIAEFSGGVIFPLHVLYSLLTEHDPVRENAFSAIGANEDRLRQTLKKHLFPEQIEAHPKMGRTNPRWN